MNDDNGVYLLISPTENDSKSEEYRVAYLDSSDNITWEVNRNTLSDVVNPAKVKSYFDKSTVHTNKLDAVDEANRIYDNLNATDGPIYYVYITTPYVQWSTTSYAKEKQKTT